MSTQSGAPPKLGRGATQGLVLVSPQTGWNDRVGQSKIHSRDFTEQLEWAIRRAAEAIKEVEADGVKISVLLILLRDGANFASVREKVQQHFNFPIQERGPERIPHQDALIAIMPCGHLRPRPTTLKGAQQ